MQFDGMYLFPGLETIRENTELAIWFGRYEQQIFMPILLDSTVLDSDNSPTDLLRVGTVLGQVTSTKKYKVWNPLALGTGEERVGAILANEVKVNVGTTARDRWCWGLVKGNLKSTGIRLPNVPGTSTALLSAGTSPYEILFRNLATQSGQFTLDDQYYGSSMGYNRVLALVDKHASAYTLTEADNGSLIHTLGVATDYTVTVPSAALFVGFHCRFLNCVDFQLQLTFTTDQAIAFNDAAASTISYTTAGDQIGGAFDLHCITIAKWFVIPHNWADGVLVQTITLT